MCKSFYYETDKNPMILDDAASQPERIDRISRPERTERSTKLIRHRKEEIEPRSAEVEQRPSISRRLGKREEVKEKTERPPRKVGI